MATFVVEKLGEMLRTALGSEVAMLLADPSVTEVRLNADGRVWETRLGVGKSVTRITIPPDKARNAIFIVASSIGSTCDEDHPEVQAELPLTGERFEGLIPPIVKNPVFAIRKKALRIFTLADLVAQHVLSDEMAQFLIHAMNSRKNIIVAGGTDSGKTTFANALLDVIKHSNHTIHIIEDTRELQCDAPDVTFFKPKSPFSLNDVVRACMRLSPNRIVIGEVRGPEALPLLKAWNTGHEGGISTVHANSAEEALPRLEELVEEANVERANRLVARSVDIVVYMEQFRHTRVIKEIIEVKGLRGDEYATIELFKKEFI